MIVHGCTRSYLPPGGSGDEGRTAGEWASRITIHASDLTPIYPRARVYARACMRIHPMIYDMHAAERALLIHAKCELS
jgi:hypothetical protein